MNLPPLPKNFASAVDLSSLGRPASEAISTPGVAVTQANLISEILPASNNKVSYLFVGHLAALKLFHFLK